MTSDVRSRPFVRAVGLGLTLGVLALGCGDDASPRVSLGVQLLTDLRAGDEFATIELEVEGAPSMRRMRAVADPRAYLSPQRVADVRALTPDAARIVTVRLLDGASTLVLARRVVIDHRASATRTVALTRSCVGVSCDEMDGRSCLAGECVRDVCADGTEAACSGRRESCEEDADCDAPACHEARCTHQSCFVFEAKGACTDAGATDAGSHDGGPMLADAGPNDGGGPPMDDGGPLMPPSDAGGNDTGSPLECDGSVCRLDAACARHTYGKHHYWICQRAKPYAEAKAFCEADGTTLAIIDDASENAFISSLIRSATGVSDRRSPHYIGLDDEALEGTFVWVDGSPLVYDNWEPNAPNNNTDNQCGSENCATMFANGFWTDYCCLGGQPFVCEK